jgi:phage replication-related protein YjqB (UPF0714/DUF867 family)
VGQRDTCRTFAELAQRFREDREWRHMVVPRSPAVAVLAPHGGSIEPGTSEIAIAIAGEDLSLYCFEGCRRWRNEVLHISSTHFDDPVCLDLLEYVHTVVAIHGCADRQEIAYLGGLHAELRSAAERSLTEAGFRAVQDATVHGGTDVDNICNRGVGRRGLQIEISRGLRAKMFAGLRTSERQVKTAAFAAFVSGVRAALPPASAPAAPSSTAAT